MNRSVHVQKFALERFKIIYGLIAKKIQDGSMGVKGKINHV
jgi:hypothetical protein